MKIFITGATGFIGTHLVQALDEKGHQLKCLVRKSSKIEHSIMHRCEIFYGDVTDKASVLTAMQGCNYLINLANIYSFWEPDASVFKKVNVAGMRNVMEAALELGIKKVIHVSTAAIFGKPAECPFNERSQPGPFLYSEYARTKYEGEMIAWNLHKRESLPLVVLYPVAVIGPGDFKATGQYIRLLVNRKLPVVLCTNSTLTFVHVKDVVIAIEKVLDKNGNIGEKYIIGKERLKLGVINRIVGEIAGISIPKIELPRWLALLTAHILTLTSNIVKKPPIWGLTKEQLATMITGFEADGKKAEKELGIQYVPVVEAIRDTINSMRSKTGFNVKILPSK